MAFNIKTKMNSYMKKIENSISVKVNQEVDSRTYQVTCPHCGEEVSILTGKNTCPYCTDKNTRVGVVPCPNCDQPLDIVIDIDNL